MSAFSAQADTFGFNGANGPSGGNGANGSRGQDATILASGQSQILNLAGGNGGDGGSGYDGANASGCYQPGPIRADVWGASGGNGGDAGMGGTGGSGGNLVVYYKDIQTLKNIAVDALPGVGGRSGRAGQAGAPCGCYMSAWQVPIRECHNVQVATPGSGVGHDGHPAPPSPPRVETVCETFLESHVCQSGSYGRNGSSYQNGSSGEFGAITLIPSATPLTAVQPTTNVKFGTFPSSVVLTLDKWSSLNGARNLFAPGSRISDTYQAYAGRMSVPVSFVWNAPRPQSAFASQSIVTFLDRSGKVSASLQNNSVFADLSVSYAANGAATVTVNNALVASDVTKLSGEENSLSGTGQDVAVTLNDAANVSDVVQTQVYAVVKSEGIFSHTRFEGNVPVNLIEHTASGVVIHIGQLEGIPSGDLKNGKKMKINLTVTRALGDKTANQTFEITGKLAD